jgi:hypothetical protein
VEIFAAREDWNGSIAEGIETGTSEISVFSVVKLFNEIEIGTG